MTIRRTPIHSIRIARRRTDRGVRIEEVGAYQVVAMTPPAESAPAARGEIGGLGRLPLLRELAGYRERLGPILASTVLPFALVLYLALEGGGYDVVVRSEVGMALWWIVLLGALVGVLPVRPLGRAELIGLGLLLAFAVWTALGISWSESSERSVEEVARVLTFLAVLALSLSAQDREALRRTVRSIGAAIALVGLLALLSRLEPSWFPQSELGVVCLARRGAARLPAELLERARRPDGAGHPAGARGRRRVAPPPHPGPGDGRPPGDGAHRLPHPLSRRRDRDRRRPRRLPGAPPAPARGAPHPRARRGRRRARDRGGDPAARARGQPPERDRRAPGR